MSRFNNIPLKPVIKAGTVSGAINVDGQDIVVFTGGGTTVADTSGNGRNATAIGGVTFKNISTL